MKASLKAPPRGGAGKRIDSGITATMTGSDAEAAPRKKTTTTTTTMAKIGVVPSNVVAKLGFGCVIVAVCFGIALGVC